MTISTPANAAEYWQYEEEICTLVEDGIDGFKYVCRENGDLWICYEGWPAIPCGPAA